MKRISASFPILLFILTYFFSTLAQAQDKIYFSNGTITLAKVTEVGPIYLRYSRTEISSGPVYTIKLKEVDSIVYQSGAVDDITIIAPRRVMTSNIPQLNTWSFNLLGFTHLSLCQSYERRVLKGKIGIRVPLYIGFSENVIAGLGTFIPLVGVTDYGYNPNDPYSNTYAHDGVSVATGFNPRYYLFKHRVIRIFAGPEANIGVSVYRYKVRYNGNYNYNFWINHLVRSANTVRSGEVSLLKNGYEKANQYSVVL